MIVKNLAQTDFTELLDCFLTSFENYFVTMPTVPDYYQERWKNAKVDYRFSYGMFDNGKLVGFIINAIDNRNGHITAFNAGTGVLPEYRGQRIVQSIYDHAIPDLKYHGIDKCSLEVITENIKAVKAYQRIGFEINKNYKCFNGEIKLNNKVTADLMEIPYNEIEWNGLPNQEYYSWENQSASIQQGKFNYFQVLNDGKPESFFIINQVNGYVPQFDILNNESKAWDRLFTGISLFSTSIKINNVDERLNNKINYIESIGLVNHISQYEMAFFI
jgi:ribosomal protein S18 acetylase RimI-like enzyme